MTKFILITTLLGRKECDLAVKSMNPRDGHEELGFRKRADDTVGARLTVAVLARLSLEESQRLLSRVAPHCGRVSLESVGLASEVQ